MSLVYKCDRCGEIIPDEDSVGRKIFHRNFVRGNIVFDGFYGNHKKTTISQFNREITLCKDCDDSFIHWFQSGKEE
jgi:hypothetical protein